MSVRLEQIVERITRSYSKREIATFRRSIFDRWRRSENILLREIRTGALCVPLLRKRVEIDVTTLFSFSPPRVGPDDDDDDEYAGARRATNVPSSGRTTI